MMAGMRLVGAGRHDTHAVNTECDADRTGHCVTVRRSYEKYAGAFGRCRSRHCHGCAGRRLIRGCRRGRLGLLIIAAAQDQKSLLQEELVLLAYAFFGSCGRTRKRNNSCSRGLATPRNSL